MKTLSYSNVKYTPRVPSTLLTVKKIEHANFYYSSCSSSFVCYFLSLCFLSFFYFSCNSKTIWRITNHLQTKQLLCYRDFPFLVIAACKLRLMIYGFKHESRFLFRTQFCVYLYTQTQKLKTDLPTHAHSM